MKLAALAVGVSLTALALPASASVQAKPEPTQLTLQAIGEMSPHQIDLLFTPLREVAGAVDSVGRTSFAGIYSGVALNGPDHAVDVYVTDTTKAIDLISAASKTDPRADLRLVRLHKSAYTKQQLDAARDAVLAQSQSHHLPYEVWTTAVRYDGSELVVGVSQPVAAQQDAPQLTTDIRAAAGETAANVKVDFIQGTKPRAAYNKYDDTNDQIGGDQLYSYSNGATCTAGFAADDSAGHNYLVTAGHCYDSGASVITYTSHTAIGTVSHGPYTYFDSELLSGNRSGKYYNDEGEGLGLHTASSAFYVMSGGHAYSYVGDWVYQNGVISSYYRGWTPHNILVDNSDTTWDFGSGTVRGVTGHGVGSGIVCIAQEGDSGGTVFASNGGNRQLRGIVDVEWPESDCNLSATDGAISQGGNEMGWVEATDILNHWGLTQDTKP